MGHPDANKMHLLQDLIAHHFDYVGGIAIVDKVYQNRYDDDDDDDYYNNYNSYYYYYYYYYYYVYQNW